MSTTGKPSRATRSTEAAERFTLAAAGAVIVGLTGAAFWLSYAHLAEVAGQHGLAKSPERQWAWPGTLDAFIVIGELLMLRAGLRKVTDGWAIALTAIGSVGSIALNVAGVSGTSAGPIPVLDYVVAAVPPTAALLAFGVLMRQIHQHVAVPRTDSPADEASPLTTGTSKGSDTHSHSGASMYSWTDGSAVPTDGSLSDGDRAGTVPQQSHGPQPVPAVPASTTTVKAEGTEGTVPDPGTGDRRGGDRPTTVPTNKLGPHTVPTPSGDRPEGTDGPHAGDRPEGTVPDTGTGDRPTTVPTHKLGPHTVPTSSGDRPEGTAAQTGTVNGPRTVPSAATADGDRPGHGPAKARNSGIRGDRPRRDTTSTVPGTGDRQGTVPGTEADGPRPHPVPEGGQDNAGDSDGDRGSAEAEDVPADRRQATVPKPKQAGDHAPDQPGTGRGPRSRSRLTEDELVTRLRPHVRKALQRDGNEAVTRVQLRTIMRAQQIPIRNDRLTHVLARLRDDNTTTRRSR
ncbi:DUF2637 domain-containing protein [Streptomyces sp. NPDC097617]|uniref:DUF2637 domain-containing protein n=1 Tax=Streptomyces sp. NPDC097617 TaxID=3366091 RepID=UPI0037F15870